MRDGFAFPASWRPDGHWVGCLARRIAVRQALRSADRPQLGLKIESTHGADGGWFGGLGNILGGSSGSGGRVKGGDSVLEAAAKSAARAIGSQVGREMIRGGADNRARLTKGRLLSRAFTAADRDV